MTHKQTVFGLIVGNRGFFPDQLARDGRAGMKSRLEELGHQVIVLDETQSKFGCVETWPDAKACADLFKQHREVLDGVVVTLPNFGDERAVADTLKLAGLDKPVLVHAWQDDPKKMSIQHRRDSFCGKMSTCNNLAQYNLAYSLTRGHTLDPSSDEFAEEVDVFAATCRVVNGLRNCRVGALGARPAAFNTVRYSEKLLQQSGITVETLDLSEAFGRTERLDDADQRVQEALQQIAAYVPTQGIPQAALLKMAKLNLVIREWMAQAELDVSAIQCWTSLEEYYGVVPCTVMSMMSDTLTSSACEVDVCGAIAMHALALASRSPSFLLDWNNNYGEEADKCVCFHCSNLPKSCLEAHKMDYQEIIAGTVGKENTFGTVVGRIKADAMSYARISTLDTDGIIAAYVGEGRFTRDKVSTFGGYGVAEIENLQSLLRYICRNGFEHHVAMNHSTCARALHEAFTTYLGWETYWHNPSI